MKFHGIFLWLQLIARFGAHAPRAGAVDMKRLMYRYLHYTSRGSLYSYIGRYIISM